MKLGRKSGFDVESYFESLNIIRAVRKFPKNQVIFSQGDIARDVFYLQRGRVKRTVVSRSGKEAVVGILAPGDFFGEWGLSDQPVCIATATAITPAAVLVISKEEILRAFHTEHALADGFISYLLARTMRIEEDLVDQLFNSTEKRLARALLRLARYGHPNGPVTLVPKISQQTLADMIGTTRTHVNYYMNKFRRLGFIEYNGEFKIHRSLLNVILRE
jgi:CRP/FNR family transcriptional regulator, cyclic AMP receptor protein